MISLLFGQLARISFSPQIACYPHDLLILVFLVLTLIFRFNVLAQLWTIIWTNFRIFFVFLLLVILSGWWPYFPYLLTPLLYTLRLGAYLLFGWSLSHLKIFTRREWLQLLTIFFTALALVGLLQFIAVPDVRFLEDSGWDDHYFRLIGTWFDPAFTALAYVLGGIFVAYNQYLSKRRQAILLVVIATALVLTFSRSAYLAALVVTAAAAWRSPRVRARFRARTRALLLWAAAATATLTILALTHPSDSTNLLRVNSIRIRSQMFAQQLRSLTPYQWLVGRGLFVPLSDAHDLDASATGRQVAAFPDNIFLLIISFFGLPMAIVIFVGLVRLVPLLARRYPVIWQYLLAVFTVSLFNQATFQPLIVVTVMLLVAAS